MTKIQLQILKSSVKFLTLSILAFFVFQVDFANAFSDPCLSEETKQEEYTYYTTETKTEEYTYYVTETYQVDVPCEWVFQSAMYCCPNIRSPYTGDPYANHTAFGNYYYYFGYNNTGCGKSKCCSHTIFSNLTSSDVPGAARSQPYPNSYCWYCPNYSFGSNLPGNCWYHATIWKNSCTGATWCDNSSRPDPGVASTKTVTKKVAKTGTRDVEYQQAHTGTRDVTYYNCHYIDEVEVWSECYGHIQVAAQAHWADKELTKEQYDNKECYNIPLTQSCNQTPAAEILSPTPGTSAPYNEANIQFEGSATDPDGDEVVAWEWFMGECSGTPISTEQNFTKDDFEKVTEDTDYQICLRVQDSLGEWSDFATTTITIEACVPDYSYLTTHSDPDVDCSDVNNCGQTSTQKASCVRTDNNACEAQKIVDSSECVENDVPCEDLTKQCEACKQLER